MFYINKDIVWKPILGVDGVLTGISLDSAFAHRCRDTKLTTEEQSKLEDYLWRLSEPQSWQQNYKPSDVFMFYEDSLLIQGIHSRHAGSGDWITIDRVSQTEIDKVYSGMSAIYSYHHSEWHDRDVNLWLQYAFNHWTEQALAYMEHDTIERI